jgi:hypothetical protein
MWANPWQWQAVELLENRVNQLESSVGHPDGPSLELDSTKKSDGEQIAIDQSQQSMGSLRQSIEALQRCSMPYISSKIPFLKLSQSWILFASRGSFTQKCTKICIWHKGQRADIKFSNQNLISCFDSRKVDMITADCNDPLGRDQIVNSRLVGLENRVEHVASATFTNLRWEFPTSARVRSQPTSDMFTLYSSWSMTRIWP